MWRTIGVMPMVSMRAARGPLVAVAVALVAVGGCGGASVVHELPEVEAAGYATAYISQVVAADPDGEHVVISTNWDQRTDMGGWALQDADGNRLPLGIGRQLDPGATLQVYSGCGTDGDTAVYACLDDDVLDDDGDTIRLLDSAGGEVASFPYGDQAR